MAKLESTLHELARLLNKNNITYLVTRLNPVDKKPDDIDLLVKTKDFEMVRQLFTKNGYTEQSHDQALGGRKKGYQKNYIKGGRVKIDLHKDFTWRNALYFDINLLWQSKRTTKVSNVNIFVPGKTEDAFSVLINIIFEKEYFVKSDDYFISTIKTTVLYDDRFSTQAKKFGWNSNFNMFVNWFRGENINKYPLFIPLKIVIFSYAEQLIKRKSFNAKAFLYYLFFRFRFLLNGKLPYE